MPQPKICDVLNNSVLHAGVPEIIAALGHFAALEQGRPATLPALNNQRYAAEYGKLKAHFAQFYQLDPAQLTWQKLHSLLTLDIQNNSTAAQLMLGPVLRLYMGQPPLRDEAYAELNTKMAAKELYTPLGIKVQSYERSRGLARPELDTLDREGYIFQESKINAEVFLLKLYNEGRDQWERLSQSELGAAEQSEDRLARDCPAIRAAYEDFSSRGDATRIQAGLKKLQGAVADLYAGKRPTKEVVKEPKKENVPSTLPLVDSDERHIAQQTELAGKAYAARLRKKFGSSYKTEAEVKQMEIKVQALYGKLFDCERRNAFKVEASKQIKLTDLNNPLGAEEKEQDGEFAIRLQEAELRSFRQGKRS